MRSVSRSRSRSPHRVYDSSHHHQRSLKGGLLLQAMDKESAKAEKPLRYDLKAKYPGKVDKKKLLRETKKYYDNGYDNSKYHHHKAAAKKSGRQRSRSRDKDNRRR